MGRGNTKWTRGRECSRRSLPGGPASRPHHLNSQDCWLCSCGRPLLLRCEGRLTRGLQSLGGPRLLERLANGCGERLGRHRERAYEGGIEYSACLVIEDPVHTVV